VPGVSGLWGERSVLSAFFLTRLTLNGLAAAEDCFVDPPGAARAVKAVKPNKRPTPTDTALNSSEPGLPQADDLAFWPVAPVWQLTRDNTALLSSGASQAPAPSDRPDSPLAPVPPTTIPEPGTVSLLLVALMFIALKQVRR